MVEAAIVFHTWSCNIAAHSPHQAVQVQRWGPDVISVVVELAGYDWFSNMDSADVEQVVLAPVCSCCMHCPSLVQCIFAAAIGWCCMQVTWISRWSSWPFGQTKLASVVASKPSTREWDPRVMPVLLKMLRAGLIVKRTPSLPHCWRPCPIGPRKRMLVRYCALSQSAF